MYPKSLRFVNEPNTPTHTHTHTHHIKMPRNKSKIHSAHNMWFELKSSGEKLRLWPD